LTIVSGNAQNAITSTPFASPLVVQVNSAAGPDPGVLVSFSAKGPVSLSALSVVSNISGQVQLTAIAGSAAGTATVTASVTGGYSQTFTLTILPAGPGTVIATAPPAITAVLDAASNTPNIAQGSIFIVKGSNLSASGYTAFSPPRPTASSGVKVTFTPTAGGSGTDAYLVYLYNQSGVNQLACILPSTVAVGSYNVTVTNGTPVSAGFATQVVATKFGLFTQDSSGSGLASVQNYISASVVDLNRLTTGTVGSLTISPAKPGQPVIAYGTGLGAYAAGDNAASAFDFSKTLDIQAVVGGVSIPVAYAGLNGYAGEDQLNFTLPPNVPTGCSVSLQISVNGNFSALTYISIAPDANSTACAAPGFTTTQLQNLDQGGTYTAGGFSLSNLAESVPQLGTETLGSVSGAFTRFTGYQLASSPASANPGACTVYQSTSGQSAVATSSGGTALDAGAITLTGPSGSSLTNAALTETSNTYSLTTSSSGLPGMVNGSMVAGTYTLTGAGGKDVGKFTASAAIGSPLTITGGLPSTVTRSAGLTLNWTGGNATDVVQISGSSGLPLTGSVTGFNCTATAGQKTFTVPASILNQLPASSAGNGFLSVMSFGTPGAFTAPLTAGGSIDIGSFLGLAGIASEPAYQ
jgi:uncharacterized protein (TIGR03437 family)